MKHSKKIAIFGGTFDPIHNGHLKLAQQALSAFSLDRVIFVPTGNMPHKDMERVTDKHHRFHMVQLAIDKEPAFLLSDYELTRGDVSYTADTMAHFQAVYSQDKLYFLCGSDVLYDITGWKDPQRIFSSCELIAAARQKNDLFEARARELKERYGCIIHLILTDGLVVSSTQIRSLAAQGNLPESLLPEAVADYIMRHQLYCGGKK